MGRGEKQCGQPPPPLAQSLAWLPLPPLHFNLAGIAPPPPLSIPLESCKDEMDQKTCNNVALGGGGGGGGLPLGLRRPQSELRI